MRTLTCMMLAHFHSCSLKASEKPEKRFRRVGKGALLWSEARHLQLVKKQREMSEVDRSHESVLFRYENLQCFFTVSRTTTVADALAAACYHWDLNSEKMFLQDIHGSVWPASAIILSCLGQKQIQFTVVPVR